jgi:hypothetical protein
VSAIRRDLHRQHRDGVDQVNSKHDVAYDLDVVQCVPLLRLTLKLSRLV